MFFSCFFNLMVIYIFIHWNVSFTSTTVFLTIYFALLLLICVGYKMMLVWFLICFLMPTLFFCLILLFYIAREQKVFLDPFRVPGCVWKLKWQINKREKHSNLFSINFTWHRRLPTEMKTSPPKNGMKATPPKRNEAPKKQLDLNTFMLGLMKNKSSWKNTTGQGAWENYSKLREI